MTREEYKKILTMAIGNEIEAYDFYKGVSEKVTDTNIKKMFSVQKKMFQDLSVMEKGHKTKLEQYYVNAAFVEVW